jgi:hypothetical protein
LEDVDDGFDGVEDELDELLESDDDDEVEVELPDEPFPLDDEELEVEEELPLEPPLRA